MGSSRRSPGAPGGDERAPHPSLAESGDLPPAESADIPQTADERERVADERERVADEREWVDDEREQSAGERERVADERERVADERERALSERETELSAHARLFVGQSPAAL